MKKLLLLFVCIALVFGVFAANQKDDKIPVAAKSGFAAKYPAAQKAKWSIEKPGEFEVDYVINGNESSALVDAKGNIIEAEVEMKEQELPQSVKAAIAKDFAGFKIGEVTKATDAKGAITYEMQATRGKDKLAIEFDASGKLISKALVKKEKEKEEDEKDDEK